MAIIDIAKAAGRAAYEIVGATLFIGSCGVTGASLGITVATSIEGSVNQSVEFEQASKVLGVKGASIATAAKVGGSVMDTVGGSILSVNTASAKIRNKFAKEA